MSRSEIEESVAESAIPLAGHTRWPTAIVQLEPPAGAELIGPHPGVGSSRRRVGVDASKVERAIAAEIARSAPPRQRRSDPGIAFGRRRDRGTSPRARPTDRNEKPRLGGSGLLVTGCRERGLIPRAPTPADTGRRGWASRRGRCGRPVRSSSSPVKVVRSSRGFGGTRNQAPVAPHQHPGHGAQPRLEPIPRWRLTKVLGHELDVAAINVYRRSAHVSPMQQFKLGRRATPYFGDDPEAVPRSVAA